MKQTAVEWLASQLGTHIIWEETIIDIIEQAKEMEKDQICEAYAIGGSPLLGPWEFGEDYYNENFKQEEQQAKEIEKQQKKDTKTMEKLIESNRKFDEKNNNSIKYNPNDRSEDNPNVTNFFI